MNLGIETVSESVRVNVAPKAYEERPVEPWEQAAHAALEQVASTLVWNRGERHVLLGPLAEGRTAVCVSYRDLHDTLVGWYSTAWRAAGGSYFVPNVDDVIHGFLAGLPELEEMGWD